jgi:hypothetical protein
VAFARCEREGVAGGIGDVKKALEGFPALVDVVMVEHDSGQADECLIGYVVPSGPQAKARELRR